MDSSSLEKTKFTLLATITATVIAAMTTMFVYVDATRNQREEFEDQINKLYFEIEIIRKEQQEFQYEFASELRKSEQSIVDLKTMESKLDLITRLLSQSQDTEQ